MQAIDRLTRWFAKNLGVDTVRKEQVYLDLAQSLTLTDTSYWIQVLFAAGIATLGLVLNSPAPPPTTAQLQSGFLESAKLAIESLMLPPPAQLVSYQASTSPVAPLKIQIIYLSERDIDRDGLSILIEDIRKQLDYPTAEVTFARLAPILETVTFELNQAEIPPSQTKLLDRIGQMVQKNPTLQIELQSGQTPSEIGTIAQDRSLAIQSYLQTQWQIQPISSGTKNDRRYIVKTELATTPIVRLKTTIESRQNVSVTAPISAVEAK